MPKKKNRKSKPKREKLAQQADPLWLYQQSVQCPEADIEFVTDTYKKYRRRKPRSLREDFCGTAYFATEWVKSHKKRTALGVDLHEPTLEWGRKHIISVEPEAVRRRITLLNADVRNVVEPPVDVICAFNFSYCVFKKRAELRRYHDAVYQGLNDEGMFFCELYGGTEAIIETQDVRKLKRFTYYWDQASFNPITRETLCYIHFSFPDGSKLKRAFTYDWRLWTIPELRESLEEAGFSRVHVYWELVDDDGEGYGEYRRTEEEENQEGWLVYVVAIK